MIKYVQYYMRPVTVLIPLLLAIGCGDGTESSDQREREQPTMPIAALRVEPVDLYREFRMAGDVEPRARIRVSAQTSGAVMRVFVDEGDPVEKDQVLAELDRAEAQAELMRAKAQRDLARAEFERRKELRERELVSQAEFDAAQAALDIANSEVALWETRVAYGRIRAPEAGIITLRNIEPGEAIQSQQVAFEMIDAGPLHVRLYTSELDAVHMSTGDVFTVTIDALPGRVFEGVVARIAPVIQREARQVRVDVALPEAVRKAGVKAGFSARVSGQLDRRSNLLAIPTAAIGHARGQSYIYIVVNDQLQFTEITTGITRRDLTEVTEGLAEGDVLLATNPQEMRNEQSVRIVRWREP